MFCDTCGKQISVNAKFCRGCGAKTNMQQPASAPPPPPAPMPPPPTPAPLPPRSYSPSPVPTPMPLAPPIEAPQYEGFCLHCGYQIPDGKLYCGKCGKRAGTAPPPKPRKFCQGCGAELDDELRYCEVCGQQVPGAAFRLPSLPAELNTAALEDVKGYVSNLKISKQRIALMAASVLGIIAIFLPMVSIDSSVNYVTRRSIENMMDLTWMADAIGWIVLIFLALPLVLCILGDRTGPLGKKKIGIVISGSIIAAIDVLRIIAINGEEFINPGFSMFLMLIAALGLCVLPFIKKLEN